MAKLAIEEEMEWKQSKMIRYMYGKMEKLYSHYDITFSF